MGLVDVLEAKDIEQLNQVLAARLDQLQAIVRELRDETEVEIKITFRKKETHE